MSEIVISMPDIVVHWDEMWKILAIVFIASYILVATIAAIYTLAVISELTNPSGLCKWTWFDRIAAIVAITITINSIIFGIIWFLIISGAISIG